MLTAIFPRNGGCHIVNFRLSNGGYRTICSKTFYKTERINTLSFDDTFPGICMTCKKYHDDMYLSDLDEMPIMARNASIYKYNDMLDFHRLNIQGPQAKYGDLMDKLWYRLNKYQRLIVKSKSKKKSKYKYLVF